MENINADYNITKQIKEIILKTHPIIDNRTEILYKYPKSEINIRLIYERDNTTVQFIDGYETSKKQLEETISTKGLISLNQIKELIDFILSDRSYIDGINIEENGFEIIFSINTLYSVNKGINCNDIKLYLDFDKHHDCYNLLNYYQNEIIKYLYEKLKHTNNFKRKNSEYIKLTKEIIINSLDDNDLKMILTLIDNKVLQEMLTNLSNEHFIKLYDMLQQNEDKKRTRKLINK